MDQPDEATRDALLAALAWQTAAGATEALADAPVDRAAAAAEAARRKAAQPVQAAQPIQAAQPVQAAPRREASAAEPARASAGDAAAGEKSDGQRIADARALAAGAERLEDLRAALDRFEGSALRAHATQAVLGDGRPDAWTMVVGEAPGRDEDLEGRPFVGRSGQLLDRMLAAIDLRRDGASPDAAFYIANVIPYRPLGNRTPDDQEVMALLPFIRRQIALVRPKLLLCVGNVPAKHLMGARTGITRFRGSWTAYAPDPAEEGAALTARADALASFHPAYLLRSPERKREAWRDLLSLAEKLDALRADA